MAVQAIRKATARTEQLHQAIEQICTTDLQREVKLQILSDAESNMLRVKQAAAMGRQRIAERKKEALNF
jgi:hypothetical protein